MLLLLRLLLLVVCLLPHLPQQQLLEIMINQYHSLLLPLPPQNQHMYLHHLVLQGEMIIKVVITTATATIVEKDGEEGDMIEIGIIVVKKIIDDMIMIVTIEEDEEVVLIDMMTVTTTDTMIVTMTGMMIGIGIGIEEEIITVGIIA